MDDRTERARAGPGDERSLLWRVAEALVRPAFGLAFDLRFSGLERIPEPGCPALLAANHVSVLDPLAIALGVVRRRRMVRFLAAVEFFHHPVWGPPLRLMGQIPVRRGARDLRALEEVMAFVRQGGLAGIFPEGRVADGEFPLRGRPGVARVALAARVPVVPVGVWGTQARWPRAGLRWRPLRRLALAVAVGEPIDPEASGSAEAAPERAAPDQEAVLALTRRIMEAIEEQVRLAQRLVAGADRGSPGR
ncbi:MAG TPA: lysophospholipid acyltransferase family protein [Actinomycetota bacterium]|nr:lysophospholipid acyltransferase family protein [Actinomycetota bacterium]